MPKWNTFFGSLLFAVCAGAAYLPFRALLHSLDLYTVPAYYSAAICAIYLGGLNKRTSFWMLIPALFFASIMLQFGAPQMVVIGISVSLFGIVRSIVFATPPARALLLESSLAVLGLGAAAYLSDNTAMGTAFGVWAFFVFQSCYLLIGSKRKTVRTLPINKFDNAINRAQHIMNG